uniref:Uncharacterized protein n=1 Tax=Neospora caninum (strain Liverpool) TaxID=572307 RepID=A0A0F7UH60_NEOCL|nr:TPA: hypothetical protein BN1204_033990 [Neospora caninum Liverpool]
MSNAARDGKLSSTAARWNRAAGSKPQGFLNSRQPPDLVPSTSASDNGRRRPTGLGTSTCPVYGSPVGSASPQLNRKPGATRLSQKEGISNNPVRVSRRCSLPLSREDASLTTSRGLPGSCAATAFTKLKREPQQKRACISSHKKIQGVASTSQAAVTILQDGIQRYGPSAGSEHMLRAELAAAEEAIRTGLYSVWRNEYVIDKTKYGRPYRTDNGLDITDYHECFRICSSSRCFCGHSYKAHRLPLPIVARQENGAHRTRPAIPRFPPSCSECHCSEYRFIPDHPDAIAEPWLSRRAGFEASAWAAKCQCKHTHLTHDVNPPHRCRERGCGCSGYTSAWECLICDGKWQDHVTIVETAAERSAANRAVGPDFMPLNEMPELQERFSEMRLADRSALPSEQTNKGTAQIVSRLTPDE